MQANIMCSACPSRQVLELIADRWTVAVIQVLAERKHRYGEIRRIIEGISPKMLTHTLRGLERDGLVERKVYPVVPPQVEYSLTPLGETLIPTLGALRAWAEANYPAVLESRARWEGTSA